MSDELYRWLEETFKRDNHKKYHKYFDEWFSNITESQIFYFNKQRISLLNESMIQH